MNPAIEELRQRNQWVAHTADKVPIGPDGPASTTNATTWMSFDEARQLQRARGLAGVGFVMSKDDEYVGIDLDNAIGADGLVKDWAMDIVCGLTSYTEVSPSGTGLHIWVRGRLPAGGGSRIKVGDGLLEVYDKARYFTVTARHLAATPDYIADWGGSLGEWYWQWFEQSSGPDEPFFAPVDEDLDAEVLEALDYIDSTDYQRWVVVGFALKDHFGDAGFEHWRVWSAKAGNYCGDEKAWRKWRSLGKKKGVTYKTIFHFAMEEGFVATTKYLDPEDIFPGIDAFCESILGEPEEMWEPDEAVDEPEEGVEPTPFAYDAAFIREHVDDRKYLIGPGFAGLGDVIVMAGPPKSMKSFITLDMLTHFACGETWHGIGPTENRKLRALVLNCELHVEAIAQRLRFLGKKPEAGTLHITPRIRNGITQSMVDAMVAHVDEHGPFDIVVVDPIANMFTEDNENDNNDMMRFLGHLVALRSKAVSDDAILWLVHHSKKASQQDIEADPFNSFRGASSLRGFYDTGIAVWRKKDDTLGMAFELRNGEGKDRLHLDFDGGVFGVAEVVNASSGDLDILASVMLGAEPNTKAEFARRARAKEKNVRGGTPTSERTWRRRIDALMGKEIVEVAGGISWAE